MLQSPLGMAPSGHPVASTISVGHYQNLPSGMELMDSFPQLLWLNEKLLSKGLQTKGFMPIFDIYQCQGKRGVLEDRRAFLVSLIPHLMGFNLSIILALYHAWQNVLGIRNKFEVSSFLNETPKEAQSS